MIHVILNRLDLLGDGKILHAFLLTDDFFLNYFFFSKNLSGPAQDHKSIKQSGCWA